MSLSERFDDKIMRDGVTSCWWWTGYANRGYGRIRDNRRSLLAHRVSWELHKGPIPPGMCVCHHCDQPACVNPDHLFLGTPAQNSADRDTKGRHRAVPSHGESHGGAKLTDEQVRAIRASGEVQKAMAARLNISRSVISNIVNRKSWRHVA